MLLAVVNRLLKQCIEAIYTLLINNAQAYITLFRLVVNVW